MTTLQAQLRQHLTTLRLPTFRTRYQSLAQEAEANGITYEQYLNDLVCEEVTARHNNMVQRYLKDSDLPLDKSWDLLERTRLPKKVQLQVTSLCSGDFLDRHENVLLFGNPGTGKSHIACAIAQRLVREGRRIKFYHTQKLVELLLQRKSELRLTKALKQFNKYEAIILDDIGYVQHSQQEIEVLFTFLAERYERASVIITSNLPFSEWEKIFKDKMTTVAAIDRLIHHCVIIELNIESYRVTHAKLCQDKSHSNHTEKGCGNVDESLEDSGPTLCGRG